MATNIDRGRRLLMAGIKCSLRLAIKIDLYFDTVSILMPKGTNSFSLTELRKVNRGKIVYSETKAWPFYALVRIHQPSNANQSVATAFWTNGSVIPYPGPRERRRSPACRPRCPPRHERDPVLPWT
jgi:hypothetical protein